jgi:hypothetical protein
VLRSPKPHLLPFQLFFQSREQVVVRRGQIRRIRWVIKTLKAQVGQFLLGCKCPVSCFLPGRAKDLSAPLYWRVRFSHYALILCSYCCYMGTAVPQWLSYCPTNQKVPGSIPDCVMEFFVGINPFDRTMTLGSTQL